MSFHRGYSISKILKKTLLLISFILIIGIVLVSVIKHFSAINMTKSELERKNALVRNEYIKLFPKSVQSNLVLKYQQLLKSNHPFVQFFYDNKYQIFMHKVNLSRDFLPKKSIKVEKGNAKTMAGVFSGGFDLGDIKFSYSSEHDSLVTNILITYDKILKSTIEFGDSIINYEFKVSKLSFRYNLDQGTDFEFIGQQRNPGEKPAEFDMNVTLYKKGACVYIIIMYTRFEGVDINSFSLPDILGIKHK